VFIVSLMIRCYGLSVAQAGAVFGVISAVGSLAVSANFATYRLTGHNRQR
jgi:hypothetical protein